MFTLEIKTEFEIHCVKSGMKSETIFLIGWGGGAFAEEEEAVLLDFAGPVYTGTQTFKNVLFFSLLIEPFVFKERPILELKLFKKKNQ